MSQPRHLSGIVTWLRGSQAGLGPHANGTSRQFGRVRNETQAHERLQATRFDGFGKTAGARCAGTVEEPPTLESCAPLTQKSLSRAPSQTASETKGNTRVFGGVHDCIRLSLRNEARGSLASPPPILACIAHAKLFAQPMDNSSCSQNVWTHCRSRFRNPNRSVNESTGCQAAELPSRNAPSTRALWNRRASPGALQVALVSTRQLSIRTCPSLSLIEDAAEPVAELEGSGLLALANTRHGDRIPVVLEPVRPRGEDSLHLHCQPTLGSGFAH